MLRLLPALLGPCELTKRAQYGILDAVKGVLLSERARQILDQGDARGRASIAELLGFFFREPWSFEEWQVYSWESF